MSGIWKSNGKTQSKGVPVYESFEITAGKPFGSGAEELGLDELYQGSCEEMFHQLQTSELVDWTLLLRVEVYCASGGTQDWMKRTLA